MLQLAVNWCLKSVSRKCTVNAVDFFIVKLVEAIVFKKMRFIHYSSAVVLSSAFQVMSFLEKRSAEVKNIILDTPGQIEVFTWSASGSIITETLVSWLALCTGIVQFCSLLYSFRSISSGLPTPISAYSAPWAT